MKREILFRGKRPFSGKWIEGYLFEKDGFSWILSDRFTSPECSCEVLSDTVGQFIGLTDKSGVKIFEGDVVKGYGTFCDVVSFANCMFIWDKTNLCFDGNENYCDPKHWGEVIGNIHDNPELL